MLIISLRFLWFDWPRFYVKGGGAGGGAVWSLRNVVRVSLVFDWTLR